MQTKPGMDHFQYDNGSDPHCIAWGWLGLDPSPRLVGLIYRVHGLLVLKKPVSSSAGGMSMQQYTVQVWIGAHRNPQTI